MMRNAVSLIALLGAVSKISIAQAQEVKEEVNSLKSKEFHTPYDPQLKSLHEIVYSNQEDEYEGDEDDGSFYNPFDDGEFTADLKTGQQFEEAEAEAEEFVDEEQKQQEQVQGVEVQQAEQGQEQDNKEEAESEEAEAHFGNESNLKVVDMEQGRGGSVSFSSPESCSYDDSASSSSSYYSSDASSDCYSSSSRSSIGCSYQPQQPYPLQPAPCMRPMVPQQPQPCMRPVQQQQSCMIPQPPQPCNGPVLPQPCGPNPNHYNPLFELPFDNDESEETFDLSRYSFNFCDAAIYGIVVNLRMIGLRFPRYERTAERTSLKVYFIEMIEKFPCENQRKIIKTILKAYPADFSDKKGFNRWAAGFSKKLLKAINFPFGMNLKGMLVPLDGKKKK